SHSNSSLLNTLHKQVKEIKSSSTAGVEYMKLDEMIKKGVEEGREEGIKEGREEGREEGIKEGVKEGRRAGIEEGIKIEKTDSAKSMKEAKEPIEKIMKYTGLSKEEIEEL
ncbi:MAG: hypothetical protein VB031_05085, partial [Eubacteriaceae bacterium]|nr:hypothetical protein [Eubacteriaceae bacterium]